MASDPTVRGGLRRALEAAARPGGARVAWDDVPVVYALDLRLRGWATGDRSRIEATEAGRALLEGGAR